jgi:hypothetical protein
MNPSGLQEALDSWETDGGPSAPTHYLPMRNPEPRAIANVTYTMRSQPLFGIIVMIAGLMLTSAGMNFSRPFSVAPSYFIAGGSICVVGLFVMLIGIRKRPPKQPSLRK